MNPQAIAQSHIKRYPKFTTLFVSFIFAYILFTGSSFEPFHKFLSNLGYFGTFLVGLFFSYGFTSAPATAMLLTLSKTQNIWIGACVAGFGALISDLIIFKFIRTSFTDEIKKLAREPFIYNLKDHTPYVFKRLFLPILACLIIASPFPDELGVFLFSALGKISTRSFIIFSYFANTIGVIILFLIGRGL